MRISECEYNILLCSFDLRVVSYIACYRVDFVSTKHNLQSNNESLQRNAKSPADKCCILTGFREHIHHQIYLQSGTMFYIFTASWHLAVSFFHWVRRQPRHSISGVVPVHLVGGPELGQDSEKSLQVHWPPW